MGSGYDLVRSLYKNPQGQPFELTPSQEELFDEIVTRRHPRFQAETYSQFGKLVSDDTPILTVDGWKEHGSLKVGDTLFNHRGQQVPVTAVLPKAVANCAVEISTGETIKVHENHEWLIQHRGWKKERVIETREMERYGMRQGGRCHTFSLPLVQPLHYEEASLPIDPYTLGVWLGDGVSAKPSFTGHPKDSAIASKIPYSVSSVNKHKDTGVLLYNYYRTPLWDGLKTLGLVGRKHIPNLYKRSSVQQRIDLLAGLIDTDGYVFHGCDGHPEHRVYFTNVNATIVDDVAEVIRSLGMRCSITRMEPCTSSSGIVGKKAVFIIGFVPSVAIPTVLARKAIHPVKLRRQSIRSIRRIEPVSGNCITVGSGDGIYLVGKTLVPTHNSDVASMALVTLASNFAEEFTVVAPTLPKARIIGGYAIGHIFDNDYTAKCFDVGRDESKDRIRRERSKTRLTFRIPGRGVGAINIVSADATKRSDKAGDTLMGRGAPNVLLDEAALINDPVFAKVLRMIGGHMDGWLGKLGNPFRRNHFLTSHDDPHYHKLIVDYRTGIAEGRLNEEVIREARSLPYFDVLYEVKFPNEDTIDDANYMPLILEEQLEAAFRRGEEVEERGARRLALDPAKGGCENVFTVRTENVAYIVAANHESDISKTGEKVIELIRDKAVLPSRVTVDAIGLGESIVTQCKMLNTPIQGVYVGDPSPDPRFTNLKAYAYWQMREWIVTGGALRRDSRLYQLLEIRYREEADRRVSIEPKERLRMRGIPSPDAADSLMLTFIPLEEKAVATGRSEYGRSPLKKYYPKLNV